MVCERSDSELLVSADGPDFEAFYLRHVDLVTRYVARRVARADLTIDVVSETFARALQYRDRFEPERGPAIGWLLTIARNILHDAARRGRVADETRRLLQMQPLDLNDADLLAIEARGAGPLVEALRSLPIDQREAVRRRVLDEDPYVVIADEIGCTEQVVRQRVRRGLLNLRRRTAEQRV